MTQHGSNPQEFQDHRQGRRPATTKFDGMWFFPYMSNSDLVLAMLAWLVREERAPTMKPPIEVLPTVVLTQRQVYGIFAVTVLGLPGLVAAIGGVVWWRRRR